MAHNSQTESGFFSLSSIWSYLGEENHERLRSISRLGQKKLDASRPRIFLLQFHSQFDCMKLLSKSYKLKSYCSPVFISKSLSPSEQITLRKLLKMRSDNIPKKALKKTTSQVTS